MSPSTLDEGARGGGPRQATGTRRLPRAFWVIWSAVLVLWIGRFVVPFLSVYLTSSLQLDAARTGLIVSTYGFGGVLASLAGGFLSDRFGRLPVVVASQLGAAALLLLLAIERDVAQVALTLFAYGAVGHLSGPALSALVADLVPPPLRARAFALQVWAINCGYAIGPLIAGAVATWAFSLIFVLEAATLVLVSAVLGTVLLRRGIGGAAPHRGARTAALSGYRVAARDRVFLLLLGLMIAYMAVYAQGTSTLGIVMTQQGYAITAYSILLTINGIILCVFQLPLVRVFERVSSSAVLTFGVMLTGVGYFVQAFATSWWTYALSVSLWTVGELGIFPVASALVADLAPERHRGVYQGLWGLVFTGGLAIGPLVGGSTLAVIGARPLWFICSGALLLIAASLWLTRRSRERRRPVAVSRDLSAAAPA